MRKHEYVARGLFNHKPADIAAGLDIEEDRTILRVPGHGEIVITDDGVNWSGSSLPKEGVAALLTDVYILSTRWDAQLN